MLVFSRHGFRVYYFGFDRQEDVECGTFTFNTGAFSPEAPAVHFNKAAANGQAETGATSFTCGGRVYLCKFLENGFQLCRGKDVYKRQACR